MLKILNMLNIVIGYFILLLYFKSIMGLLNFALKLIQPVRISYLFALEVVQNTNIAIGMGVIEAYLFEIDLMYVQHQGIKQTKGRGIQKWPYRKILSDIIENRIVELSLNHIFLILFGLIQLVELGEFN